MISDKVITNIKGWWCFFLRCSVHCAAKFVSTTLHPTRTKQTLYPNTEWRKTNNCIFVTFTKLPKQKGTTKLACDSNNKEKKTFTMSLQANQNVKNRPSHPCNLNNLNYNPTHNHVTGITKSTTCTITVSPHNCSKKVVQIKCMPCLSSVKKTTCISMMQQ